VEIMKVFLLSAAILLSGCSKIHDFDLDRLYEKCQEHGGLRYVYHNVGSHARCNDGEYVVAN
jgi:hypothetical protein